MPLNERDMSYFIDIVECIYDIIDFTSNISYLDFKNEKMRKLAVERQLEIIGQASVKISREVQEMYPNIPWPQIIGLRNRLAHDYGEILVNRIWDISQKSIRTLLEELMKIDSIKDYINSRK